MPNFLLEPIGTKAGLTSITLGVVRALQRSGRRAVYYKPVAHTPVAPGETEPVMTFAEKLFHLTPPRPYPLAKVEELVGAGRSDDLIELVVSDFSKAAAIEHDVAVIEGVVPDSERNFLARKNGEIAAAVNAQIILVASVQDAAPEQVADQISLAAREYQDSRTEVVGFILNKFTGTDAAAFAQSVSARVRGQLPCMGVVPFAPEKSARRMLDIARYLNTRTV
ncbi:MAG: AAA family ATPase, partial [Eikenella sp.]|nr:AAA family ATPase [Eikenella sp.]